MIQPLALVLYEKLLPGTQLVNRLQDLNYRVQVVSDPNILVQTAQESGPMLVFADLESSRNNVCTAIGLLKKNPSTSHLPVIAFGSDEASNLQAEAKAAGATLIVSETALLTHLAQFLEQALQIE